MGFTLPYRFGGLNCPNLVYTMANEIVSRADASLMNIFGLQGIAETINAFASEEIKQKYLPLFAAGKVTGAMVLTEPDAGSRPAGRQAAGLPGRATATGSSTASSGSSPTAAARCCWCWPAASPDRSDGLGLSLLLCDRGPTVHVRRLEDKLGIHGSPTCEIFFDNTPCQLIGERQRGLVTYVMSLMNGARIGIAAQSLGIAEAAYRVARDYAPSRKQFGVAIEKLPAVRDLLIDMKIDIEAGRALLYETSPGRGPRASAYNRSAREQSARPTRTRPRSSRTAPAVYKRLRRHAHADEQVLLLRDVQPRRLRLDPGPRRQRLHAGLRLRAARPRRPHHDDLRRHQPAAGRRGGSRRLQRHGGKVPGRTGRPAVRSAGQRPAGHAGRGHAAVDGGRRVHQGAGHRVHGPLRPGSWSISRST